AGRHLAERRLERFDPLLRRTRPATPAVVVVEQTPNAQLEAVPLGGPLDAPLSFDVGHRDPPRGDAGSDRTPRPPHGPSTYGPAPGNASCRRCFASPPPRPSHGRGRRRSEEHTSELQSRENLVCRLLLE